MKLGFMNLMTTKDIIDDIDFTIKNNFNAFEIDLDWEQNWNLRLETLKEIRIKSESNNIQLNVHTPWFLPTAAILPKIRNPVIKVLKKGIIFAKKVHSHQITVHPGYSESPIEEKNYGALIKTMKEVVKFGKNNDVMVGLENNAIPDYPCFYADDLLRVVNSVDGLRITLDVGHVNITQKPFKEYYKKIKDFVIDVHVHDNDGTSDQHRCIGDGRINFNSVLKELKKNDYKGPFILEIFPYENVIKGKKRFLKIWNSV
jgi:sugar phosphate isomerase/epimerase